MVSTVDCSLVTFHSVHTEMTRLNAVADELAGIGGDRVTAVRCEFLYANRNLSVNIIYLLVYHLR